jgi:hypothetical protein
VSRERLATIARVQADLVAAGVPAPAALAGPLALGNGWLTVEEHCDGASFTLVPEAALVGSASVIHPVDWRLGLPDPLPTLEQLDGFVADYEAARGAPFDDDEREALVGGQRWVTSYGARCQHSDDLLGIFPDVDHSRGWPRLLRELLDR